MGSAPHKFCVLSASIKLVKVVNNAVHSSLATVLISYIS
jgi:hypothetical protein